MRSSELLWCREFEKISKGYTTSTFSMFQEARARLSLTFFLLLLSYLKELFLDYAICTLTPIKCEQICSIYNFTAVGIKRLSPSFLSSNNRQTLKSPPKSYRKANENGKFFALLCSVAAVALHCRWLAFSLFSRFILYEMFIQSFRN